MSRGFVKDGDQEETPMIAPRAYLPEGMPNYVTASGLEALQNEMKELEDEKKSATDRVTANWLGARIALVDERIRSARLQEVPEDCSKVAFGHWVSFRRGGKDFTVRITGVDEADASKSLVSFIAPLAKNLLGHSAGEKIACEGPKGQDSIEILAISATPLSSGSESTSATVTIQETSVAKSSVSKDTKTIEIEIPAVQEKDGSSRPLAQPQVTEDPMERLPLVNERGVTIGSAARFQVHDGSRLLHPVVHLQLYNSKGELYLQKRPEWKKTQPGKWDTAVGGHIGFGEKPDNSLQREMEEELGITGPKPKFVRTYIMDNPVEREFVYLYTAVWDGPVNPTAETDGGRFWTKDELRDAIGKGMLTPDLENYVKTIL